MSNILTVSKLIEALVDLDQRGYGDKPIVVSKDSEGNDYHYIYDDAFRPGIVVEGDYDLMFFDNQEEVDEYYEDDEVDSKECICFWP